MLTAVQFCVIGHLISAIGWQYTRLDVMFDYSSVG